MQMPREHLLSLEGARVHLHVLAKFALLAKEWERLNEAARVAARPRGAAHHRGVVVGLRRPTAEREGIRHQQGAGVLDGAVNFLRDSVDAKAALAVAGGNPPIVAPLGSDEGLGGRSQHCLG